ncbi:hypothetical protein MKW92_016051 [Papaver armeniacum]|nr:hypothetical protein MKW92_016051 [Papaver armeniacum]
MVGMTQALTTQFKSCRLLRGNVWHKDLSKKRSRSRNVVANQNSHIQLVTAESSPFFTTKEYIEENEQHLSLLDVLLVRTHFCQSIRQARQLISHRRACVNNAVRSMNHFKLSPGDVISFQNNEVVKVQNQPIRLGKRTKVERLRLLKTKVRSHFLQLHILIHIQNFISHRQTSHASTNMFPSQVLETLHIPLNLRCFERLAFHLYNFAWRVLNLAQNMTIPK